MRVCVFGDSVVNGAGDEEALGWVGRFTRAPLRRIPGLRVYNLGIVRDTSADIAARWEAEAARRLAPGQPHRLAFSFGANDCVTEGDSCRVPEPRSLALTREILTRAASIAPTLMIGPIPVLDDPAIDARVRALSAAQADLCAEIGVPFLAIFDFILGCEVWRREAAAGDGTHPASGGYAALAGFIEGWPAARAWLHHPDAGLAGIGGS